MGDTEIGWTHRPGTRGRSWNPTQGCSILSEGCRNCYAMRMAARFAKDGWSKGLINIKTGKWNGEVRLQTHKLIEPLSWREPSTVFVNSMSDLFHEKFTNEQIAAVFGVMAACPRHTFQILTKRAKRMREWLKWMVNALPLKDQEWDPRAAACWDFTRIQMKATGAPIDSSVWHSEFMDRAHLIPWPLPNVWLGVSVEHQEAADERIPELLETPAAIRFLSCEPLLGELNLHKFLWQQSAAGIDWSRQYAAADCYEWRNKLHWLIAGCESGPGARTCEVAWLRSLREQCKEARLAFFLKQAMAHSRDVIGMRGDVVPVWDVGAASGTKSKPGGVLTLPYLDGVQHAAFPEVPCG